MSDKIEVVPTDGLGREFRFLRGSYFKIRSKVVQFVAISPVFIERALALPMLFLLQTMVVLLADACRGQCCLNLYLLLHYEEEGVFQILY